MSDYIKRLLGQLVAGLLSYATRLARLTALRQLLEESTAALEEAAHLEAKGHPELARFLRAELDDTLDTALGAGPERRPALNGDAAHDPFALPRPMDAAPTGAAGEGTRPPQRRGRRPSAASAAKPEQQMLRENPAAPADSTASPTATTNPHL